MDWIAKVLANPSTVVCLVSTLFVLATVFSLRLRVITKRSRAALEAGIRIIDEVTDPLEFAANYDDIAERIRAAFSLDRWLTQQWQTFESQLARGRDKVVHSYREPERLFNSNCLLKDKWVPLCKASPSYLVGMGLVFTFLGIAVVTYRASSALGSNNDLQALRDLLGAASLKFWTSLVGVALSIITSGYFRHLTAQFEITASEFSQKLSRRLSFRGQETSVELSNDLLSRQLDAVVDLRITLLQQDRESVAQITKELKSLREDMVSVTADTFARLVELTTKELSNAIDASLKGVAQTFDSVNTDLKRIVEQIAPLPGTFGSLSHDVNRSVSEVVRLLQVGGRDFNMEVTKAKESARTIAAEFLSGSNCAQRMKDSLSSHADLITRITASFEHLGDLHRVSQTLKEMADSLRSCSVTLLTNWQQQSLHIKSVDQSLANTVATLPTVFGQYSESLGKFSQQFEDHLETVLGSLTKQIESLESAQNSLMTIAQSLHAAGKNGSNVKNSRH